MPGIATEELKSFFKAVEAGRIRLVAESEPQDVYAGNVVYRASNGWRLVVFNDANEYDYVDHVQADDGRTIDFDQLERGDADWNPDDEATLAVPWHSRLLHVSVQYLRSATAGRDGAKSSRHPALRLRQGPLHRPPEPRGRDLDPRRYSLTTLRSR